MGGSTLPCTAPYWSVCAVPSLLVSLALVWLPDSPRYLAHQGRQDLALTVLRTVYTANTGQPATSFPLTSLDCTVTPPTSSKAGRGLTAKLSGAVGLGKIKQLFSPTLVR